MLYINNKKELQDNSICANIAAKNKSYLLSLIFNKPVSMCLKVRKFLSSKNGAISPKNSLVIAAFLLLF